MGTTNYNFPYIATNQASKEVTMNSALDAIDAQIHTVAASTPLSGDSDVLITSPANNDVLTYEAASSKWKNKTSVAGASTLAADTDVVLTSPANNDVLTYETSSSKWKNKPATGGGGGNGLTPPVVYGRTVVLNVAITSTGSTTFDAPAMSPVPDFVTIDSEQFGVTSISGTTWTVTRGDGGTSAATHLISATVTEMLWSHFNWKGGDQLFTGTSNGFFYSAAGQASSQDWVIGMKTAIGTSAPYTITFQLIVQPQVGTDYYGGGVFLQLKGAAPALMFELFQHVGGWYLINGIDNWTGSGFATGATGLSTVNGWLASQHPNQIPVLSWVRIVDDGTSYLWFYASFDGVTWIPAYKCTRNTDITNPDYVGVYASPRAGALGIGCSSITITSP
jgi:hypothetical protein